MTHPNARSVSYIDVNQKPRSHSSIIVGKKTGKELKATLQQKNIVYFLGQLHSYNKMGGRTAVI